MWLRNTIASFLLLLSSDCIAAQQEQGWEEFDRLLGQCRKAHVTNTGSMAPTKYIVDSSSEARQLGQKEVEVVGEIIGRAFATSAESKEDFRGFVGYGVRRSEGVWQATGKLRAKELVRSFFSQTDNGFLDVRRGQNSEYTCHEEWLENEKTKITWGVNENKEIENHVSLTEWDILKYPRPDVFARQCRSMMNLIDGLRKAIRQESLGEASFSSNSVKIPIVPGNRVPILGISYPLELLTWGGEIIIKVTEGKDGWSISVEKFDFCGNRLHKRLYSGIGEGMPLRASFYADYAPGITQPVRLIQWAYLATGNDSAKELFDSVNLIGKLAWDYRLPSLGAVEYILGDEIPSLEELIHIIDENNK